MGRISASKCKRVASLKPTTSPTKALKDIMSYSDIPQTTAMRESLKKKKKLHKISFQRWTRKVSVVYSWRSGFFISMSHGYLGASPYGIIHLPTQSDPGVLEMKYIQVKPGKTLKDVLVNQSICTENESSLILNKNQKYFYQLCHQMFSTTYKWGYHILCHYWKLIVTQ